MSSIVTSNKKILLKNLYWASARFPLKLIPDSKIEFLDIDSKEREEGESKFGFIRLLTVAIDVTLSLMTRQRLIFWIAFTFTLAGILLSVIPMLSALILIGALLITIRYKYFTFASYATKIKVSESANIVLPDRS